MREILGVQFSRPSTSFYATIFKMATSRLNMPYNDPFKLHAVQNLVSKLMFLNITNMIKMIIEWLTS